MTPELASLNTLLAQLYHEADAISFYDALAVVRLSRQTAELPELIINNLLALYHAPQSTDGAKDILGGFLKTYAQRLLQERAVGNRQLVLKDSGKVARIKAGSQLVLHLEERRASGFSWQITEISGPITCARRPDIATAATYALFHVDAAQPGRARLALREELVAPPALSASRRAKALPEPRLFQLDLVVEAL